MAVNAFRRVGRDRARRSGDRRPKSTMLAERARPLDRRPIRSRLERPDGVFVDGLRADGTQSPHASQQANAFALAYGVVPDRR